MLISCNMVPFHWTPLLWTVWTYTTCIHMTMYGLRHNCVHLCMCVCVYYYCRLYLYLYIYLFLQIIATLYDVCKQVTVAHCMMSTLLNPIAGIERICKTFWTKLCSTQQRTSFIHAADAGLHVKLKWARHVLWWWNTLPCYPMPYLLLI